MEAHELAPRPSGCSVAGGGGAVTGRLRLALLGLLVLWFFSPPTWRYAVPLWLPFAVAVLLEAQFVVGGLRAAPPEPPGRAPQRQDLEEFGWEGEPPEEDDPAFWTSEPVPPRRTHVGRRVAEAAIVLAVVAAVAYGVNVRRGWSSLPDATRARVERVLSRQATKIAGHDARVHCDTSGRHVGYVQEADGLAEVGGTNAWVTPSICFTLYRLEAKDELTGGTGRAIAVLAHESWHLHGVADEGAANCRAFHSGIELGAALGLERDTARGLMREQYANNASDSAGDPRYLVPKGCAAP